MNTQERILRNFEEAAENYDLALNETDLALLKQVIDDKEDELENWTYRNYDYFVQDVLNDGLKYVLHEYNLYKYTAKDLGLPTELTITLDKLNLDLDEDNVEESIFEYLNNNYDEEVISFDYGMDLRNGFVIVKDIEWDI